MGDVITGDNHQVIANAGRRQIKGQVAIVDGGVAGAAGGQGDRSANSVIGAIECNCLIGHIGRHNRSAGYRQGAALGNSLTSYHGKITFHRRSVQINRGSAVIEHYMRIGGSLSSKRHHPGDIVLEIIKIDSKVIQIGNEYTRAAHG